MMVFIQILTKNISFLTYFKSNQVIFDENPQNSKTIPISTFSAEFARIAPICPFLLHILQASQFC